METLVLILLFMVGCGIIGMFFEWLWDRLPLWLPKLSLFQRMKVDIEMKMVLRKDIEQAIRNKKPLDEEQQQHYAAYLHDVFAQLVPAYIEAVKERGEQ